MRFKNQACTGCHACQQICPQQCIAMTADEEGFLYPQVDDAACVGCGLCARVCPALHPPMQRVDAVPAAYACMHRDDAVRAASSSGGIFTLLAEAVLQDGGVVFGAVFDGEFAVVHAFTEQREGLEAMRGSKYVQSRVGDAYARVKAFLRQNRSVLFSGTPCQIAGLRAYLGKDEERLFCVDIICHGAPSPLVWKRYVEFRRNSTLGIRRIAFRLKNEGWRLFSLSFAFANDTEYRQTLQKDLYMQGFLQDLYLRPSCHACRFKTKERQSDVTLADFWGVEHVAPELDDDRGTSLAIVHSEKGRRLFAAIEKGMECRPVELAAALRYNPAMIASARQNHKREAFFRELREGGRSIEALLNAYTKVSLPRRAYRFARRQLGKAKRALTDAIRGGDHPCQR